uniref:Low density lipoprotein receptor-related protein 12 n=1 Tax=Fundulus heteroclitus TaxID=8078 RepID=A0A3Q2PR78_FUNHE
MVRSESLSSRYLAISAGTAVTETCLPLHAACGDVAELLRASSGVITSPGWPFQYPARLNCSWNIRARAGDSITISFQDFDLQGSHRCTSDWMSISSYRSLDGLRVCGSSLPPPYISSQDHVWIHFHSDDSLTGKGFRLSYITGKPEAASCDVDQFHCSNGKCIPDWWRCNSMDECGDNSDEELCVDSPFSFQPCNLNQFPCLSRYTRIYTCLPHSLRCDGSIDCQDLGDEIDCDVPTCGEWLRNFYGSFSSPNYPDFYPPGSNCTWLIDTGDHRKVILRFTDFKLDGTGYGDYVKVYDGLEENPRRLLRVLTAFDSRAPVAVVSSSGQLRVHFYADKINAARGFNVTYQVDGFCLPWEVPCGGNWGCYTEQQRCDGYWHCPNGRDELNCSSCQEDEFPCSRNGACYPRSDRCNYQNRCPNGSDEKNCFFCQPGNFHCKVGKKRPTPVSKTELSLFNLYPFCHPLTVLLAVVLPCSASVLENLRLAVRSQLGFTSIRLPSSGRHRNLWRRLFTFSRSRRSGSLALVSADLEDSSGTGSTGSSGSDLLSPDSDDTDTEGERGRERGVGAVGGPVAPLPHKTPPPSAVEAVVSVAASVTSTPSRDQHRDRPRETPPPSSPRPSSSALQRLAQNLHRLARNLTRTNQSQQNQPLTNHSPLRQLETGRSGAEATERRGSREEEEDVELLIPVSDSDSSSSSSSLSDIRQPLLEPHPSSTAGPVPLHQRAMSGRGGRDGTCEHCGMVHTAQIPDACLEATGKTESSDDELLLLC